MNRQEILQVLPKRIEQIVQNEVKDWKQLQEIRIRQGQKVVLRYQGQMTEASGQNQVVESMECKEILSRISQYSLYAFEEEIRKGYITIPGGHRIGIVGRAVLEQGEVKTLRHINSFNIRVCHEKIGCANRVMPYVLQEGQFLSTLIISPPGGGKTTLLRDIVRYLSAERNVTVVDERSEIGGCYQGVPQHELGIGCDVLDACPKIIGMEMVLRSMAPDVIAVDEIGTREDYDTLQQALYSGCAIVATRHGEKLLSEMISPLFRRYIVLRGGNQPGEIQTIYDERGQVIWK